MHLLLVIRMNAGSMNFKCQEPWFIFYIQFTDFNCRAITLLSKQVWAEPSEHYNYLFLSPYKFSLTSYFKTFPITIKEKWLATEIIFWIFNWNPEFWQEMEKEEKKKHTHGMSLPLNLHASTHRGKHTSAAVVKPELKHLLFSVLASRLCALCLLGWTVAHLPEWTDRTSFHAVVFVW